MLLERIAAIPNFEAIFGVAADHRLDQVRSRSRGGAVHGTFWNHEEYDADGRLVARYESFQEVDSAAGTSRSGWVKYDADGWVVDEGRIAASRWASRDGSRSGEHGLHLPLPHHDDAVD